MKNIKILNFRPLLFIFIFLACGIIYGNFIIKNIVLYSILFGILLVIFLVVCLCLKQYKMLIIGFLCFALGIFGFYSCKIKFDKAVVYSGEREIVGTIASYSKQKYNFQVVYLDNVTISQKNYNGRIMLKISDYYDATQYTEIGNVLKFRAEINKVSLYMFEGEEVSSFLYDNNIQYTSEVYASNIELLGNNKNLAQKLKEKIRDNLFLGMDNENAELAYSALFGELAELNEDTQTTFSISGITHLLAVSGQHVMIIIYLFAFLFTLLKIKGKYQLLILIPVMLFYSYLCNFSFSILRSVLMAVVLIIAPMSRRNYDMLSSISMAGIIILIFSPLAIFSAQFILSFACVLGIIFLHKPIARMFSKIKLPSWINEPLSITLAVQIGVFLPIIYYFQNVQLLSLITNLLVLPLFSFAFAVIFVIAFLGLILPQFNYVLYLINPIFMLIKLITTIIISVPFAEFVTVNTNFLAILIYALILFVMGRFCLIDKQAKYGIITMLTTLLIINYSVLIYFSGAV